MASAPKRKPFVVMAAPRESFAELKRAAPHLEAEGWGVVLVDDPDALFALMVSPRCFCVFISEKFRVNPNLIIERARDISDAQWVLVTETNQRGVNLKAANSGASAMLSAPVSGSKYLSCARRMFEAFYQSHPEAKAKRDRAQVQTATSEFSFHYEEPAEGLKPLVVLALRDHAFIKETVTELEAAGWTVRVIGYLKELAPLLKKPECFCVFISHTFCERVFERIERLRKNSAAKWILVTSNVTSGLQKNREKLGLDGFLHEPGQPAEYAMKAKALLEEIRAAS